MMFVWLVGILLLQMNSCAFLGLTKCLSTFPSDYFGPASCYPIRLSMACCISHVNWACRVISLQTPIGGQMIDVLLTLRIRGSPKAPSDAAPLHNPLWVISFLHITSIPIETYKIMQRWTIIACMAMVVSTAPVDRGPDDAVVRKPRLFQLDIDCNCCRNVRMGCRHNLWWCLSERTWTWALQPGQRIAFGPSRFLLVNKPFMWRRCINSATNLQWQWRRRGHRERNGQVLLWGGTSQRAWAPPTQWVHNHWWWLQGSLDPTVWAGLISPNDLKLSGGRAWRWPCWNQCRADNGQTGRRLHLQWLQQGRAEAEGWWHSRLRISYWRFSL